MAPHDVGPPGYEYGFAGRSGSFTSADYYAASKEFSQSFSDTNQQPGNDVRWPRSRATSENLVVLVHFCGLSPLGLRGLINLME